MGMGVFECLVSVSWTSVEGRKQEPCKVASCHDEAGSISADQEVLEGPELRRVVLCGAVLLIGGLVVGEGGLGVTNLLKVHVRGVVKFLACR